MRVAYVVTISDRCSAGEAPDTSGPYIAERLGEWDPELEIRRACVPDQVIGIQGVLNKALQDVEDRGDSHLFISSGGTGLSPRDVTITALSPLLDKLATGIMTAVTAKCLHNTPFAMLSNPLVGIKDNCVVVCLPGSKKAVRENLDIILPVLGHVLDLVGDKSEPVTSFHTTLQNKDTNKDKSKEPGHVCPHQKAGSVRGVAHRARHSPWPMLPVPEALSLVARCAGSHPLRTTTLSTQLAPGQTTCPAHRHVTCREVLAEEELPNYRASVKDGYAVLAGDGPGVRRVAGASSMGCSSSLAVGSGAVARVTTGGLVPLGADAVVQVEDTELVTSSDSGEEEQVRILARVGPGTDIRPVGSDVTKGEVLLPSYTYLNSSEIGLLNSQGITEVEVNCKPRVAVLSTGDELVLSGEALKLGQVRDSNTSALVHLLSEDGYPVSHVSHLPDTLEQVERGLEEARKCSDILITTGGVSMGECDHMKTALPLLGATIHFGRVHMKPGKPTTFATWPSGQLYFGLPGNPVSAMVTYKLFVLPALKVWEGLKGGSGVIKVSLPETRLLDPRPEYIRAVYTTGGEVRLTGGQCSSRLLSMRNANLLLQLPPRSNQLKEVVAGTLVEAMVIGQL